MKASELIVDKVTDALGNPIIDTTTPGNPVKALVPELDRMNQDTRVMNAAEYHALVAERRAKYAGSGQVDQKDGDTNAFYNHVVDDAYGDNYLYHTKIYGGTTSYEGMSLRNIMALPLHAYTNTTRSHKAYLNIAGKRIKFDGFGSRVGAFGLPRNAAVQFNNGLTGGIEFQDPPMATVEANSAALSKAYKQGDMLVLTDPTRELLPYGNFTAPNANVVTWNSALGTVAHDPVAGNYVYTCTAISDGWTRLSGVKLIAGVTYRMVFDFVPSVVGATPHIFVRPNTSERDVCSNIAGNQWEITFTPRSTTDYVLIGFPGMAIGNTYTLDNVSIKATDMLKLQCKVDVPAGSDVYAIADSFQANDSLTNKDFVFIECWDEDVSTHDFVYPNGCVQWSYATGDLGAPVAGTFVGADTYSLFSPKQAPGDVVGYGYVWSTLTPAQKATFAANPDNNLYLQDSVVMQTRYRVRVLSSLCNTFVNDRQLDNNLGGDGVRSLWIVAYPMFVQTQGPRTALTAEYGVDNGSLAYTGTSSTNGLGCWGRATAVIPHMMVQRRNPGIYHESYNPQGTAMVFNLGVAKFAHEVASIASVADCFNPAFIAVVSTPAAESLPNTVAPVTVDSLARLQSGAITGFVQTGSCLSCWSGRPDKDYYDSIYAHDVEDRRMNANKVGDYKYFLEDQLNRAISARTKGSLVKKVFKPAGRPIIKTGIASIEPYSGPYNWRINFASKTSEANTGDIHGVMSATDKSSSRWTNVAASSVLLVGDNGSHLWIRSIGHYRYPNGCTYLILDDAVSTGAAAAFDTTFPTGTAITPYTMVNNLGNVTECGDYTQRYIVGDSKNYPASWLTAGVDGEPLIKHPNTNIPVVLSGLRDGVNGGYKLRLPVPTIYLDSCVVTVINAGVRTAIPYVNDLNGIRVTGLVKGNIITSDGYLQFNLTGTGAYDAAIEAAAVLIITYKAIAPVSDISAAGNEILSSTTGWATQSASPSYGAALTADLIGDYGAATGQTIDVDSNLRFALDGRTINPVTGGDAGVGIASKHAPIGFNTTRVSATGIKVAPTLVSAQRVCKLSMNFKELHKAAGSQILNTANSPITNAIRHGNRLVVVNSGVADPTWHDTATGASGTLPAGAGGRTDLTSATLAIKAGRLFVGPAWPSNGGIDYYDWTGTAYVLAGTIQPPVSSAAVGISIMTTGVYATHTLYAGVYTYTSGTGWVGTAGGGLAYDWNGTAYTLNPTRYLQDNMWGMGYLNRYYARGMANVNGILYIGISDTAVRGTGAVYIYPAPWSGNNIFWVALSPVAPASGDWFGNCISGSGTLLAIGSANSIFLYDVSNMAAPTASSGGISNIGVYLGLIPKNGARIEFTLTRTELLYDGMIYNINIAARPGNGIPLVTTTSVLNSAVNVGWGDTGVIDLVNDTRKLVDANGTKVVTGVRSIPTQYYSK